jgi:hypothetical protein
MKAQCTVTEVQRVQHPQLWREFARQRGVVARLNESSANEIVGLKHGTGSTDPKTTVDSDVGIDFRFSDWGLYGKGAYFGEEADYSHSGYVFKRSDGAYQMFLCRILAGKVDDRGVLTDTSIRHPKAGHHSVRGAVNCVQRAYIVYEFYRCYPEFLVTYTK